MKLKPLWMNVIIEREKAALSTPGGIVLPETAVEKVHRGTVLAAGPGQQEDGAFVVHDLKPGDQVIFGPYAGAEVDLDGKVYLVMSAHEVLAVVKGK